MAGLLDQRKPTRGLLDIAKYGDGGLLSSYEPSLRDKVNYWLADHWYGDTRQGVEQAKNLSNVLETVTPYGILTGAYDAGRSAGSGDYLDAGIMGAMAMVPGTHLRHGSPKSGLSKLLKSERGPLGPGVYTTPVESLAKRYAGEGGAVYSLPDKNFDVFTGAGHRDVGWEAFKNDVSRLKAAAEKYAPEKADEINAIIDKSWSGDGYPMYARIKQVLGSDEKAQGLFKAAGFDGLSGQVDGPETLLFNNQSLY